MPMHSKTIYGGNEQISEPAASTLGPKKTFGPKVQTSKKLTEATATDALQCYIYTGVGPRFLGWAFPVLELKDDDSWEEVEPAGPRYWKTPRDQQDVIKWAPLREHLQGAFRGLVWRDSRYVPCVTADFDRHFADVNSKRFKRDALLAGRVLKQHFSTVLEYTLTWCVEVNPRNGSVKFFGWSDRPMRTEDATRIGELIHECLGRHELLGPKGEIEVFPFNSPQVLLPMRIDKTTIIDSGIVPKCVRKKKCDQKMVEYETYSALSFVEWLRHGDHYCEQTLLAALNESCANLPDVVDESATAIAPRAMSSTENANVGTGLSQYTGNKKDNPNSFERQFEALLQCCRQAKRVVMVEEALAYIRQNNLYSGEWQKNLANRRSRVRWILKRIACTFDASKGSGIQHNIKVGKYGNWARTHIGSSGIKELDRYDVDEFGNVTFKTGVRHVRWKFASICLSVIEHCLISCPNEDGSVPQHYAELVWNRLLREGQIDIKFCDKKWAILRKWLESRGVIKIVDRNWHRDKAMRWRASKEFETLHEWWRRKKEPSPFEAVALAEFLANKNTERRFPLNYYSTQGESVFGDEGLLVGVLVRPPP